MQTFVEFFEDVPKGIFESSELDLSLDKLEDTERMLNCNEFSEVSKYITFIFLPSLSVFFLTVGLFFFQI